MGWGVSFAGKKRYEDVRFNVISVTRVGGVKFPGKKRYLHLVGVGLRRVSDFLENTVTNVMVLRVTLVWVGVKFPETTVT